MHALRLAATLMAAVSYLSPALSALFFRRLMLRPRRLPAPAAPQLPTPDARLELRPGWIGWRWGEGPVVVLAHGWEGHHRNFAGLIAALRLRGLAVLALDMPAHGASSGRDSHPAMFAEAIAAALDRIGPARAVIGHSMGGVAALRAIAGRGDVARTVIIAAPSSMEGVLRRFGAAVRLSRRGIAAFMRAVERRVGVPARDLDVRRWATGLDLPVLLIHDRDDREVPVIEAARAAHVLPQARLIVTEGLGHRRLLRDQRVIDAAADFIADGATERCLAA